MLSPTAQSPSAQCLGPTKQLELVRDEFKPKQLEEVVRQIAARLRGWLRLFLRPRSWVKLQEGVLEVLIDFHNRRLVPTAVTVVGGTENRYHVLLVCPIVAFHDQLVSPGNESESVVMVELLRNILAEGVARPTGIDTPPAPLIRIRPQKVAHRALVRNLLDTVLVHDVVQSIDGGRQTSMQAEDLLLHQSGEGQVVEQVSEIFPHVRIPINSETLVIKPIHLGNLPTLVVPAGHGDAVLEAHLQRHQQCHSSHGVISPVHIVPHEQVVGLRGLASDPKKLEQIGVLSVNVSANGHRTSNRLHIFLVRQYFFGLGS